MSNTTTDLNETEYAVLADLVEQNGSDFAFANSLDYVCTKAQRSGYVSQLIQKDYVREYGDPDYPGMLVFSQKTHKLFNTYHYGEAV